MDNERDSNPIVNPDRDPQVTNHCFSPLPSFLLFAAFAGHRLPTTAFICPHVVKSLPCSETGV